MHTRAPVSIRTCRSGACAVVVARREVHRKGSSTSFRGRSRYRRDSLLALGLVMEWAVIQQAQLLGDWELARKNALLLAMPPLE